jgi:hypothetical protein
VSDPVEAIAMAVLYEGYLLYPYSHSAMKNQVRWTFGGVHPRSWSEATGGFEPWFMRTRCLAIDCEHGRLSVTVRFLHLLERSAAGESSWQEATERAFSLEGLDLAKLASEPASIPIRLEPEVTNEGGVRREWRGVQGVAEVSAERVEGGATRVTVQVTNTTEVADPASLPREHAMLYAMASTHAVLRIENGRFVSLADPPDELREAAAACKQTGAWPIMVGRRGATDTVLASPIILDDYPEIAEESPQDLFDSTEIDELLTLSILTLTDQEKDAMRNGDERARRMLERAESLSTEDLLRLHGTVRSLRPLGGGGS